MSRRKILIIGDSFEDTAEIIHAELGRESFFLDISNLEKVAVYLDLSSNSFRLEKGSEFLNSVDIKTVWLRRNSPLSIPKPTNRTNGKRERAKMVGLRDFFQAARIDKFSRTNTTSVVQALVQCCSGARVVSDPYAMNRAANKYFQLMVARKVGLITPDTIITNARVHIADFYCSHKDSIGKFFNSSLIPLRGNSYLTLGTEALDPIRVDQVKSQTIGLPRIIQENVVGHDARITVIGDHIVGCCYEPKDKNLTRGPDYRNYFDVMNYYPISQKVFETLRPNLFAFMKMLDIKFGSMDFKFDPKSKKFVFLEMNPCGQYLWPENILGSRLYPSKRRTVEYLRAVTRD